MLLLTYFSAKSLKDGWFHFFPRILQDQGSMYIQKEKNERRHNTGHCLPPPPPQIIKNRGHQEYYDLDSFYHDHGQSYSGNVGNKEIYLFSRMRGNKISKRRKISLYLIMRKVYLASIQSFLIRKFLLKVIQENMYPPGKKYENKRRKK